MLKTIEEKLDFIKSKWFIINNEEEIKAYLEKICLFKLRKYFRNFKWEENIDFREVINHYLFDQELRSLNLEILEHLENSLKVQMVKVIWEDYLNKEIYNPKYVDNRINFIETKLKYFRQKDTDIKQLNKNKEVSCDIFIDKLTFWELIKIYRDLKVDYKYQINKFYNFRIINIFESWIFWLRFLRNLSSHWENIFNRSFEYSIKWDKILYLLNLKKNNNYISYLLILWIFIKMFNLDIKLYSKILELKYKYKIKDKKNNSPYLEHLSKDKEAWWVLVNSLYDFYVKKSNLNLGEMKKVNIIQFLPYFPPHKWGLETVWEEI